MFQEQFCWFDFVSKPHWFSVKRYLKKGIKKIYSLLNILEIKKPNRNIWSEKRTKEFDLRVFTHSCRLNCRNCASWGWKKTSLREKNAKTFYKFWEKLKKTRVKCLRDPKICSTLAKIWDIEIRDTVVVLLWSSAKWEEDQIRCSR